MTDPTPVFTWRVLRGIDIGDRRWEPGDEASDLPLGVVDELQASNAIVLLSGPDQPARGQRSPRANNNNET